MWKLLSKYARWTAIARPNFNHPALPASQGTARRRVLPKTEEGSFVKAVLATSLTVLLTGCMLAPRPYDGMIGYQLAPAASGLQVTYIDEARFSREKTLKRITDVCAASLNTGATPITVQVNDESILEQGMSLNVPMPVGTVETGDLQHTSKQPIAVQSKRPIVHHQPAERYAKLRKTVATCSR
jgi:hypothetical protein